MKRTVSVLSVSALVLMVLMVVIRPKTAGASSAEEKTASEVKINNFAFSPTSITVPVGSTVHWVNKDDIPHNIVGEEKGFRSKVLSTDQDFSYTFTKPGTYSYSCTIHPQMTAKVVVQ